MTGLQIPTTTETGYNPLIWARHFLGICGPTGYSSASTADQVSAGWAGEGKVALVTGCASGLGLESVRVLVARGCAVYAGVRSPTKLEAALAPIRKQYPGAKITVLPLDLSSLASVRTFAAAYQAKEKGLNILICNAAVMGSPFTLSADGHEMQFATNHLGHFLLTQLLLPQLVHAAAQPGAPEGRVVVVSSWMHSVGEYQGKIRFDDLDSPTGYDPWKAYGQSKLCNILFAREQARRLAGQNVSVASLHPGGILSTDLTRHTVPSFVKPFAFWLTRPLFKDIPRGTATQVYLATAPTIASGAYYQDSNLAPSSAAAKDDALAKRLWDWSEKLCA